MISDNWKNYIFEYCEGTLFETDSYMEMYTYIQNFPEYLIFENIYENEFTNTITIHFVGYNLIIKKKKNK